MSPTTQEAFMNIDTNGDGRISESELEALLRALGSEDTSPEEVRRMMSEMDKDGDGFIDYEEFAEFQRGVVEDGDGELRAAFEVYDKDKNGLISAVELQSVLKSLGQNVTVVDCAGMIGTVDADGDGHEIPRRLSLV